MGRRIESDFATLPAPDIIRSPRQGDRGDALRGELSPPIHTTNARASKNEKTKPRARGVVDRLYRDIRLHSQ